MDLFDKCIANKSRHKFTITGNTVLKFCIDPFIVWCDAFAPSDKRDPQSQYVHLLFDRGIDHEENVRKALFPNAASVSLTSFEEGFRQVLDECRKGSKFVVSAPLFFLDEDIYGIPDVLVRSNKHNSVFGDYHYVIKEIKSAKHIKHEYILQAAFYTFLLGKIQGYTPAKFYLINREMEEFEYDFEKYSEELFLILSDIRDIFKGKKVKPTAKACRWPWESYCNALAVEAGDVSIVPNVGKAIRNKLNEAGIFTVQQLASQPVDESINIPSATLQKIKLYAQAWVDKKPIKISKPKLKKSAAELFIDFEGTDELDTEEGVIRVDYLIGILVKDKSGEHFKPFVAERLSDEGVMFHRCVAFLREFDCPIYHYGPYERTHFSHLGQKYGIAVSDIIEKMVDVLSLVRKHVAFPTLSMSLKEISRFLGFQYRGMADAQESIVLYLEFLKTGERALLKRILDYNEDDVRATLVVKDFLSKL